jgi:hypothetical protein
VRRAVATGVVLLGLAALAPGEATAGPPVPWCGPGPSSVDRLPDAVPGFAVHVVYARGPNDPDRFAEWAPRLAGDAAEIEAWWRGHDPARALRFDLFAAPGCAGSFGALDLTSLRLSPGLTSVDDAFDELTATLARLGLNEPEKAYLVYYDSPTGQTGNERVCGQGGGGSTTRPALAIVFLDSCGSSDGDDSRPIVAVHELMHVLGAVSQRAPNHCARGHVCDAPGDLMAARLVAGTLAQLSLDAGRDDYYGHGGPWADVRSSLFLERLDGPDREPPSPPASLRVSGAGDGATRVSWRPSSDDVGPVGYRIYEDGRLVGITGSTAWLLPAATTTVRYSVRAADAVGHLSAHVTARFRPGAGMVDESGRLVRDTVRPPAVGLVAVTRTPATARLSWPAVRDAGGIRHYRVRIGSRTVLVRRPAVALARARVSGNVAIAAVDRAGNIGPSVVVPRGRLR